MDKDMDTETRYRILSDDLNASRALYINQFDKEWMDKRMVTSHSNRVLQQLKIEEETEKYNEYKTSHDALHDANVAQEEALVKEIELMKREKRLVEARRQQIRENSPELRDLEVKLRSAYTNRDVMQQIRENEHRKTKELVDREHDRKVMLDAIYSEEDYVRRMEESEIKKRKDYGKDLREQLVLGARRKECLYEDSIIEREKINEVLRTMKDEDLMEVQIKKQNKEIVKREMQTFAMAKNAWKEKQRQMILIEEQKLEDYEKEQKEKEVNYQKIRDEKFARQLNNTQNIAAQIAEEKAKRDEREHLVIALHEQEVLDLNIQRERQEQIEQEHKRVETRKALHRQMSENLARKNSEKEEALRFRLEAQSKADTLSRSIIEKERMKREKNLQYGIEIKRQIALNNEKNKREKEEDRKRNASIMNHRLDIINKVKEERKSMIKEFAPKALGYLQPGLLTNEDLPIVREGVANDPTFKDVDIEGMYNKNPNFNKSRCNPQCRRIKE